MSGYGSLYDMFWGKMDQWTRSRPLTAEEKRDGRLNRTGQEGGLLALSNAEANYNALRRAPQLVVLTPEEAAAVYFLFTGERLATDYMTRDARAFLQGALMAAIDGSYGLGFVKIVFDSAYLKLPPADLAGLVALGRKLTGKMLKHMYKHMNETDPLQAPLYKIVVGAIAYECAAYFRSIRQGLL